MRCAYGHESCNAKPILTLYWSHEFEVFLQLTLLAWSVSRLCITGNQENRWAHQEIHIKLRIKVCLSAEYKTVG